MDSLKVGLSRLAVFALCLALFYGCQTTPKPNVSIGYFHGGRTNMIYRAFVEKYFDNEMINVNLYTADLRNTELVLVPNKREHYQKLKDKSLKFGKLRGTEIVDLMALGQVDGGTIGESSFIAKISEGAPIVAVALLGYDRTPGKAFIYHKDEVNSGPDDLLGKVFITRRAGPGDFIYAMEYFDSLNIPRGDINVMNGYDPQNIKQWIAERRLMNKINLIPQVDEDYIDKWLQEKIVDGGVYHLLSLRKIVLNDPHFVVKPMDWMNPAFSQSVLVFNRDFIRANPEVVQKFINAYVKRIKHENDLPEEEQHQSWQKGEMIKGEFMGMSIPQYDYPPRVRLDLLDGMQELLIKYKFISQEVNVSDYVDNSFVEKAYQDIEGNGQ